MSAPKRPKQPEQRSIEVVLTFRFMVPDGTEADATVGNELDDLYEYIHAKYGMERVTSGGELMSRGGLAQRIWWRTKEKEKLGKQVLLEYSYTRPT